MGMCSSCYYSKEEKMVEKKEAERALSKVLGNTSINTSIVSKKFPDGSSNVGSKLSIDDFQLLKVIGKGSSGTVYLGRLKNPSKNEHFKPGSEEFFAIKIVEKRLMTGEHLQRCLLNEKNILQYNDCPFIAKLHFSFQSPTKLFFGLEYLPGGDLFYHLSKGIALSESAIKFYSAEIILAIEYLHKNNIIYRDLKPENLIFDSQGHLKIVDFGLSKFMKNVGQQKSNTYCGTPEYVAPEIICNQSYDKEVDWWSLVIIYSLREPLFMKFFISLLLSMILTKKSCFEGSVRNL